MRKMVMAMMLGAMAVGGVAEVQAAVNVRQLNQQRRIDAGKRSGKLSPREYATLKAEQRAIERRQAQLKARHGKLTDADKREIAAMQDRADRHILSQKHDAQRGKNHLKL